MVCQRHTRSVISQVLQFNEFSGPDLLSIPLTCRGWSDFALDRLWETLHSIIPALQLFGPMQLVRTEMKALDHTDADPKQRLAYAWMKNKDPQPYTGRWEHITKMLKRVKRLIMDEEHADVCLQDYNITWLALQAMVEHRKLLPNLHTISIKRLPEDTRLGSFLDYVFLLTDNLQKLEHPQFPSGFVYPYLPKLRELRITGPTEDETLKAILPFVPHLEVLEATPISLSESLFDATARHTTLQKLEWRSDWKSMNADSLLHFPAGGLETLMSLTMKLPLETWSSLMDGGRIPFGLRELHIVGGSWGTANVEIERCLSAVASSIRMIEILELDYQSRLATLESMKGEDLTALRGCQCLKQLIVRHPTGIAIASEGLLEALEWWPRLRMLRLCQKFAPYDPFGPQWSPCRLPLTILESIARVSPDLEDLGLCFDTSCVADAPYTPNLQKRGTWKRLKVLDVTVSPVRDTKAVALYLSRTISIGCKLAWTASSKSKTQREFAERWERVEDALDILSAQRALCQH